MILTKEKIEKMWKSDPSGEGWLVQSTDLMAIFDLKETCLALYDVAEKAKTMIDDWYGEGFKAGAKRKEDVLVIAGMDELEETLTKLDDLMDLADEIRNLKGCK